MASPNIPSGVADYFRIMARKNARTGQLNRSGGGRFGAETPSTTSSYISRQAYTITLVHRSRCGLHSSPRPRFQR
jgi:hypothetical protein